MEGIACGDTVEVCFVTLDKSGIVKRKAVVLNLPRGEGDLIQVKYLEDNSIEALNPYNSYFFSLQLIEKHKDDEIAF